MPSTTLAESGLGSGRKLKRLNLLLFGRPGTGKTVVAHSLPRTRTLDFDDGMQSVEWAIRSGHLNRSLEDIVYSTILPPSSLLDQKNHVYDLATDQVDEWLAEEDIEENEWDRTYEREWDTLIIDSGTSLTDAAKIKGMRENARLSLSNSWKQLNPKGGLLPMKIQDWGAAGFMFHKFINYCRTIGKNVVLICHEYELTDDSGTVRAILPALIGQLRQSVPKDFDDVWYMNVKGSRQNAKYVIQTSPDPLRGCRSRLGCFEWEEEADFEALRKKVSEFYGIPEDQIWTAAHGSEEREALREEEVEESAAI